MPLFDGKRTRAAVRDTIEAGAEALGETSKAIAVIVAVAVAALVIAVAAIIIVLTRGK